MFEHLEKHKKILVTGPHRSGTTFTATAIAHDLKATHGLVREEWMWQPRQQRLTSTAWLRNRHALEPKSKLNDKDLAEIWFYEIEASIVMQAPFLADCCHQFPGVYVVYMIRNPEEVERSMVDNMRMPDGNDVQWRTIAWAEHRRYHSSREMQLAKIKYDAWELQKVMMHPSRYTELEYDSLDTHPLWLNPEQRKGFHVRQTRDMD